MTLIDNMRLLMPLSPNPADPNMEAISNALEIAMTAHIRIIFAPGIGATFLASLPFVNPFLIALGAYLDATISPIISTALAAQPTVGGPLPAWLTVQPSFDALILAVPSFMAGIFGALFWQALLVTIRLALPPPPPISENSGGGGHEEVLKVDR